VKVKAKEFGPRSAVPSAAILDYYVGSGDWDEMDSRLQWQGGGAGGGIEMRWGSWLQCIEVVPAGWDPEWQQWRARFKKVCEALMRYQVETNPNYANSDHRHRFQIQRLRRGERLFYTNPPACPLPVLYVLQ
jgi:hypothetical protein